MKDGREQARKLGERTLTKYVIAHQCQNDDKILYLASYGWFGAWTPDVDCAVFFHHPRWDTRMAGASRWAQKSRGCFRVVEVKIISTYEQPPKADAIYCS